jgi:hypothetical protein
MAYAAAALAAGLALAIWAVVFERRRFRVRRVLLDADGLGLPELRILHVTDTHFHGRGGAALRFLERLAADEHFDLVFWTGDLIDRPAGVEAAAMAAGLFRPRLGSFAVLGGHDYEQIGVVRAFRRLFMRRCLSPQSPSNPVDRLVRRLGEAGVRVLDDDHHLLTSAGGETFALVGLRDSFTFEPDCDRAWAGIGPTTPVVVIAHNPDVLPEVSARGAALAFFGHTHGGQVRLPVVGALVTRCRLPGRMASGSFRSGETAVVINNGLGTSPVTPFRFLCAPEVTVAELCRSPQRRGLTRLKEARLG